MMVAMRALMIILLVDALICGIVVGRLPTEEAEPCLKKSAGQAAEPSQEKSCYEWAKGRE